MMKPTLRDYLRIFLKWKIVIGVTFFSVVFFTVLGLQFKIPEYESEVKLLISANDDSQRMASADTSPAETECEVVASYPVLRRAVQELGYHLRPNYYPLDYCSKLARPVLKWLIDLNERIGRMLEDPASGKINPEADYMKGVLKLRDNLKVKPITNTDLFSIFVLDYDPAEAARIANMISHAYILFELKKHLAVLAATLEDQNPKVAGLRSLISQMERKLDSSSLFSVENLGFSNIKIVQAALPPIKPKLPKALVLVLAIPAGVFLGFVLVFVFERFDDTVRGPDDIKTFLNLPLLGSIPKARRSQYRFRPQTGVWNTPKKVRHSFENLAAEVYWSVQEQGVKVVQIASALPNKEVAPILTSLGAALAATGKIKVLLLDANLRNPSLHKLFGIVPQFHLGEFLEKKGREPKIQKISENLFVLPAAAAAHSPVAVFQSEKLGKFIEGCKTEYDIILLNSSGLKKNHDGLAALALADGVVYVVNEGQERRQAVATAIASLLNKKTNFLGVILNNRTFVIPGLLLKWL